MLSVDCCTCTLNTCTAVMCHHCPSISRIGLGDNGKSYYCGNKLWTNCLDNDIISIITQYGNYYKRDNINVSLTSLVNKEQTLVAVVSVFFTRNSKVVMQTKCHM